MHILDVVNIKGDARNAFDNTQQYLTQTGIARVAAFVCLEASSGKVVADAVRREKVTDRVVLAWDVEQDTLSEIKDGTIEATISQKPYTMGFVGLKELDEIFHNRPKSLTKDYSVDAFSEYPVFIDTGRRWWTRPMSTCTRSRRKITNNRRALKKSHPDGELNRGGISVRMMQSVYCCCLTSPEVLSCLASLTRAPSSFFWTLATSPGSTSADADFAYSSMEICHWAAARRMRPVFS